MSELIDKATGFVKLTSPYERVNSDNMEIFKRLTELFNASLKIDVAGQRKIPHTTKDKRVDYHEIAKLRSAVYATYMVLMR